MRIASHTPLMDQWQGMTPAQAWSQYHAEQWRQYYAQQGLELQRQQVESTRSTTNVVVLLLFLVPGVLIFLYFVARALSN